MKDNFKNYLEITKPGIIRGNLIVAVAAYIYASGSDVDFIKLTALTLGMGAIIGSAAAANNYLDKEIDSKMQRTKHRAVASGKILAQQALLTSTILGVLGFIVLVAYVNTITAIIGVFSFIFYVFIYGYFKRISVHGTLIGAIPGAAPPLAGYTAATGTIDLLAAGLFLSLVFWQMPHFYAIAILRKKDYKKAGIPVMPLVKGNLYTKKLILFYIGFFVIINSFLFAFSKTGYTFLIGMIAVNIWWVKVTLDGFNIKYKSDEAWAKQLFKTSLIVLIAFSILLALNNYLP